MSASFLSAILIVSTLRCILTSKVTWLPDNRFNLPKNFDNEKLPCSRQSVIFTDITYLPIRIDGDISISQLVLPTDGELVFGNAEILFGPDDESNCTDESDVFYLEKPTTSWSQPDVWSSTKFNEATPDAEKVPCFDDVVEFPVDSQFIILLPEKTQTVREIRIDGKTFSQKPGYIDSMLFAYLNNEKQNFIFNSNSDSGLAIRSENCKSLTGCPCQSQVLEIECDLKFCKKPACVDPIHPIGHCCKLCGGAIVFGIDNSFELLPFTKFVDDVVTSYGKEDLVYHIGRLLHNKVQVVVVEKGNYSGTSAIVINAINHRMEKHVFQEIHMSGSPLDKSGLGGNIFISVFCVVIIVMASIYLYYYKVPEIRYPLTNLGLFRYHQRTDSMVSLSRRDSGVGVSGGTFRASFRNPLYDSKRQRVMVEESAMEE